MVASVPSSVDSSSVRSAGPLSERLLAVASDWARNQHQIVVLAASFADSGEWVAARSPSPAHWLAAVADVEVSTAREWVRIGRKLRGLPGVADAFEARRLSYSKVRTLTRIVTADNEAELVPIAMRVPAGEVGRALAAWMNRNNSPEDLATHHECMRSVKWRTEPDGMVTFTLRLPPFVAGCLIAWLTTRVMTRRRRAGSGGVDASADASGAVATNGSDASADASAEPSEAWPAVAGTEGDASADACDGAGSSGPDASVDEPGSTASNRRHASADASRAAESAGRSAAVVPHASLAQQHADALRSLVMDGGGGGGVVTEVVVHVRGSGTSLDDGTPIPGTVAERIAGEGFLRALIHDADGHPINASGRQRHPSERQKRVVKERDRVCVDCGRTDLLEFDHVPPFEVSGRTLVDELELRCGPCHRRRHAA